MMIEGSNLPALALIGATVLMGCILGLASFIHKKSSVGAEDKQKFKK